MTDDLIAFLRARLDDDERVALSFEVSTDTWLCHHCGGSMSSAARLDDHLFETGHREWGPARMLAEVEAKRRILDEAIRLMRYDGEFEFLEMLALPYCDHPDYRPEWRPAAE